MRHAVSRLAVLGTSLTLAACAAGTRTPSATAASRAGDAAPGLAAITEGDLRRDLFAMAADTFRGREAGTLDELRAAAWVADRAREAGLEPAGDDGTYFQFWPMRRVRPSPLTTVAVGGAALALGGDVVLLAPAEARLDLPVVWVGEGRTADVASMDLRGKAAAAIMTPPTPLPAANVSLRSYRYALAGARQLAQRLAARGASAVIVVGDATGDSAWAFAGTGLARGRYNVDSAGTAALPPGPPVMWVRPATRARLEAPGARLVADLRAESFVYPSENVVARVRGTDASVSNEYVLFSGHHDHDGARFPIAGDSIWNGADDNASVSVAMLAIGRAFARHPGRRSALFVWHGAEERGLLGSRWFVAHPTVPLGSVVAVINGDMIGRNSPDSAALLGSQPPHRNSRALVDIALAENARLTRFVVDSSWDRPTHPEGWYFRSDHLPYARAGVPSLFFTTLLHPDYHTPRDEASRIDVAKLARMTQWMYATGWAVSQAPARPAVDSGFRLER